ncbi:LINE-1 retrotransposable element ORF2 protein [Cucumis melo var. makuwa]|uniref:LINE-1 retrotransposable element ORF2 protein n=1 Tax=Cucumis melo var. makuwa TaxID=1194695 RepID=A0A5D3DHB5_CUCMM|nr:LINE-1 retrotransposable element ORF2 protein [Cucumis melo var. makuwa]
MNLMVDMGPISPLDSLIFSESNQSTTSGRTKDSSIDKDKEDDRASKEKLVNSLKDNELKLSPKYALKIPSSSNFPVLITDQMDDIFSKKDNEEVLIDNLDWKPISSSHQTQLYKLFDEYVIKRTIISINNEKAPGPDGFTLLFYKKHWQNLKGDLLNVFHDFHKKGIINNNVNNTYIALVSKKDKCILSSNYIPISLTTSLYKIMAKALSNRLKVTLVDTIAENQMVFIKERKITDAILIANEAIDWWKQKKTKGFVLKLDTVTKLGGSYMISTYPTNEQKPQT